MGVNKVNIMKIKLKYLPTLTLTLITVLSGFALLTSGANADEQSALSVVNVSEGCGFNAEYGQTYTLAVTPGLTGNTESESRTQIEMTCNNPNGFQVKAVGFSPDVDHPTGYEGNNFMYGSTGVNISTGTSGADSYWSMKISSASVKKASTSGSTYDDCSTSLLCGIESPYSAYAAVPSSATAVLTYAPVTDSTVLGKMKTDYQIHLSTHQAAATYTGKVKYTIVPVSS